MIQTVFTLAGFVYSVVIVGLLTYLVTHFLHIGTFSWFFVFGVSVPIALIFGIHSMDW